MCWKVASNIVVGYIVECYNVESYIVEYRKHKGLHLSFGELGSNTLVILMGSLWWEDRAAPWRVRETFWVFPAEPKPRGLYGGSLRILREWSFRRRLRRGCPPGGGVGAVRRQP